MLQRRRADLVQCCFSSEKEYPRSSKSIPPLPAPPSSESSSTPSSQIPLWSRQEAYNKTLHNHDITATNAAATTNATDITTRAANTA